MDLSKIEEIIKIKEKGKNERKKETKQESKKETKTERNKEVERQSNKNKDCLQQSKTRVQPVSRLLPTAMDLTKNISLVGIF